MGTSTSSHTAATLAPGSDVKQKKQIGVGGRESISKKEDMTFLMEEEKIETRLVNEIEDTDSETETESETDESSDEESDSDDEVDEYFLERAQILAEACALKTLALQYLHPENPVPSTIGTRCYFDRPSAPEVLTPEEADERVAILEDAKMMKQWARAYAHGEDPVETHPVVFGRCYFERVEDDVDAEERTMVLEEASALKELAVAYAHPEIGVTVSDPTVTGRNYFSRPSAPEVEEEEEMEERAMILADAKAFKDVAVGYLHPERGVVSSDPYSQCRNYFSRFSAPVEEDVEDMEERERVLTEARAFKDVAVGYLHPEMGVKSTDTTAMARNYFTRPSAPTNEDEEMMEEVALIKEEAKALATLAKAYLHPEVGVTSVDTTATARNYFTRPSAPEVESENDAEERAQILAEAAALKKSAVDFAHPEIKVVASDAAAYARNYFTRPSAPEKEDESYAEERAQILAEAKALKNLAVDYAHPEMGVTASDPAACCRNYFTRPSAPATGDEDEEMAQILAEAKALKQLAVDYAHPEVGVKTSDPTACGRNYFTRPSAPTQDEFDEERAQILAEAKALKRLAVDYAHPEVGVTTSDATVSGRNYFTRPSVLNEEDGDSEERAQILADAKALKKLAVDYAHPEMGVKATDATVFGRNYFNRPSAENTQDGSDAEERAQILAEAKALKRLAVDYAHPERGVTMSDATVCGRNYFTRPSALEEEDESAVEERSQVLADALALKKLAVDYAHPEVGVTTTDATACARNYFSRPSAPDVEDLDNVEERAQILADAKALKTLAVDYAHPEVGVTSVDPTACGRNYFTKPSAEQMEDESDAEERAQILAEAKALKQLAVDYAHPEIGVTTSDATVCARNYFNRPSAAMEDESEVEERAQILAEARALKKLAVDYSHPEIGVTTSDATACARNYFTRPLAPVEDESEAQERAQILADAKMLKKLAVDYTHPEIGVKTSDPTACARNYFTRPSAPEVEDTDERAQILAEAKALKQLAIGYAHPEIGVTSVDPTTLGRNYYDRFSATDIQAISTVSTAPEPTPTAQRERNVSNASDMFEFDDDVFDDMRETFNELQVSIPGKGAKKGDVQKPTMGEIEEEGNLSRSPSSVMLFGMDGVGSY